MDRAVGKGMNYFEGDGTAVVFTGEHPAALGSEINSEIDFFGIHG